MNKNGFLSHISHADECFLPDFRQLRAVIASLVIFEMLAIMLTIPFVSTPLYWNKLLFTSIYIQWIALVCLVFFSLLRGKVEGLTQSSVAAISYVAILFVTVVIAETSFQIAQQVSVELLPFVFGHMEFLASSFVVSAIVGMVALRYLYLRHETTMTIKSEAQAQLMALQARIRPHFLFNCLNSILGLIRVDPKLAENMLEDLAELMRTGLADVNMLVLFDEEITLTRRYVSMEKLRFGARLLVVFDVEDIPKACLVPSLSIQPLVENAIYHGIEPLPEGGRINIVGKYESGMLRLIITNPLLDSLEKSGRKGHHIAMDNIRQRLTKHFEGKAVLTAEEVDGQYIVEMCIPFEC